ncbi:MAG: shikimate kinase [Liquorilactobacillus ghanensis]|jgi:shikimate kinase|uniref:Shikimate kinase n=1 Tax=Liquorilactobacillus ghanensis DSM 18630 TaxID=1423750 RepID=A0A0R1VKZ1_9LACO|nr:shikimate kinase [Liquorilactobacillus ghanensis]KRM06510.1 shikimate kinase [Liquorilactobacillus ghanensis DSM 18630]
MKAVLVGFMGSGKTTIGRLLAENLKTSHIDLDQVIVEHVGKSINDIFEEEGEQSFRQLEHRLLQQQLTQDGILSTGGGTPIMPANQYLLRQTNTPVILLEASAQTVVQRVLRDHSRPLVNKLSITQLKGLKQKRDALYRECADLVIKTDQLTPQEIIARILPKIITD